MAANKITDVGSAFFKFAREGFTYNLQVLPDVITASAALFAILFQSPPLATLGTAFLLMPWVHKGVAGFLGSVLPDMTTVSGDVDRCSGRFPGATYTSLLGFGGNAVSLITTDKVPSYYSMFVGFLAGWIGVLPGLYAKELAAAPEKARASTGGLVILGILCATVIVYRILSNCESFFPVAIGLLSGFAVGVLAVMGVAWVSDRRATNVLSLPLIRSKTEDGKPIYVCDRGEKTGNPNNQ